MSDLDDMLNKRPVNRERVEELKQELLERQEAPVTRMLTVLGEIMLEEVGPEACERGYGTTDPYWVGRYAIGYGDINPDGTLN